MFIYLNGIENQAEAMQAVAQGAAGIAVRLGYKKSALDAEQTRDWLELLPLPIFKIGVFPGEAYYDVEEMASFCHLDVIVLDPRDDLAHYSRYSGRILVSLVGCNWAAFTEEKLRQVKEIANGIIIPVGDGGVDWLRHKQRLLDLEKLVFLAGTGQALLAARQELTRQENQSLAQLVYGWYLSYGEWQSIGFAGGSAGKAD